MTIKTKPELRFTKEECDYLIKETSASYKRMLKKRKEIIKEYGDNPVEQHIIDTITFIDTFTKSLLWFKKDPNVLFGKIHQSHSIMVSTISNDCQNTDMRKQRTLKKSIIRKVEERLRHKQTYQ